MFNVSQNVAHCIFVFAVVLVNVCSCALIVYAVIVLHMSITWAVLAYLCIASAACVYAVMLDRMFRA
jgi:hypothetical protein